MSSIPLVPLGTLAAAEPGSISIGPFGSRMKSNVYVDHGVPVIRGTNISRNRALSGDWVYVSEDFANGMPNCIARPGDLVFPHRGAVGEVALLSDRDRAMVLSTSMMKFRPDNEKVDSEYLYYYFRSPAGRSEILRFGSQVGTPGIGQPLTSLRQFRVPLPSLETQKTIAGVLGAVDDKLDLNERMNESLDDLTRCIHRSWFIDFDPIHAKADGAEAFAGISVELFRSLPGSFERSQVGSIPRGWECVPLGQLVSFNPRRKLTRGQDAAYLAMTDMPTRGHAPDRWEARAFTSGSRFTNGDTLLARITPCLENGKTALVDFLPDGAVAGGSTEYIVLHAEELTPPEYLYCLSRSPEFRDFAVKNMTGTSGRQRVSAGSLATYKTIRPPAELLRSFASFARPLLQRVAANKSESRSLMAIRDSLIPRLISGETASTTGAGSSEIA